MTGKGGGFRGQKPYRGHVNNAGEQTLDGVVVGAGVANTRGVDLIK